MSQIELLKGMYVRCPFDDESEDYPRVFIMGQVVSVDESFNEVKVRFHDLKGMRSYIPDLPVVKAFKINEVTRCAILENEPIIYVKDGLEESGVIVYSYRKKEPPLQYYYVSNESQIDKVFETEIKASFNAAKVDPVQQLMNYEFQNPKWYFNRDIVTSFQNILENAPVGFETLVGARAYLFPHQIDTIMRASKQSPCRLMLADEVGLGKTIEALIIANTLHSKKDNFKTLLIVPRALMNQWQNEFEIKLWLQAQIYTGDERIQCNNVIIPLEEINEFKYFALLKQNWELVIIDEVHKVINKQDIYKQIYMLSQQVENILILTATPITARRTEYLNLLKLLKPNLYGQMSSTKFNVLVDKNNKIKEHIYEIKTKLEDYYEDEDTGLIEDIVYELEEIKDYLEDDHFTKNFTSIDIEAEDHGIEKINGLLSYTAEYYQIDRDIIRHRRTELKNKFAHRTIEKLPYMMQDADQQFYEYETYNALLEYIKALEQEGILEPKMYKALLNCMFSSSFALKKYLQVNPLLEKSNQFRHLMHYLDLFINGQEKEIQEPNEYLEDPELIKSRFTKLLDYIDQEAYDKKVVIFTSFTETAVKIDEILQNYFDPNTFRKFYKGLTDEELNKGMNEFQTDLDVKILLCDYTAGEGRNLQMADLIIHFDLPISPGEIEQRIGRLDRIGRNSSHDILSVVLYTQDTLEEPLLRVWDEAFHLFAESLSGLEIALEDFEHVINGYLKNYEERIFEEVLDELKEKMVVLSKVLREERLYDANRQLSKHHQLLIENLIEKIDDNEGENLSKAMEAWGMMAGFNSERIFVDDHQLARYTPRRFSHGSFRKAWYIPLETSEILKRSKRPNEIVGTYEREMAIQNETLAFFAPGEPIFDSLIDHAMSCYKGTCTAIEISGDFEFTGIVFKWKTRFEAMYLLHNNLSLNHLNQVKGFNMVKTEADLVRIAGDESVTVEKIEQLVRETNQMKLTHLGQRGGTYSPMDRFVELNSPNKWRKLVLNAKKQSLSQVKENSKRRLDIVKKQFAKNYRLEIQANQQSRQFYENNVVTSLEEDRVYKALLKGISNCKYELDSVYYIRVKKYGY